MTLSLLFIVQLFLAFFAWNRGWRGALVFWMALPWAVALADRVDPGWIHHAPPLVTAAGLALALAFVSLTALSWIAVVRPSPFGRPCLGGPALALWPTLSRWSGPNLLAGLVSAARS